MMGLRLAEGVPEARLKAEAGQGFESLPADRLAALEAAGLVAVDDTGMGRVLTVSREGRAKLDAILTYLL